MAHLVIDRLPRRSDGMRWQWPPMPVPRTFGLLRRSNDRAVIGRLRPACATRTPPCAPGRQLARCRDQGTPVALQPQAGPICVRQRNRRNGTDILIVRRECYPTHNFPRPERRAHSDRPIFSSFPLCPLGAGVFLKTCENESGARPKGFGLSLHATTAASAVLLWREGKENTLCPSLLADVSSAAEADETVG